jgi:hypothetical protein
MAQAEKSELHALMAEIKHLSTKLDELKKEVEHDKGSKDSKRGLDSELAFAAALMPLCGMTSLGFGNPLFLPFGLRLAAARTLVLHRALERAAKISGELAKAGAGTAQTSDRLEQLFDRILARKPEDREALVKLARIFWRDDR